MSTTPSQNSRPLQVLRHLVDLLICLMIAVILVRSFQIEGYMISTGSMAPGLLGFHKRVVCPKCQIGFQLGVAFDKSVNRDGTPGLSAELCSCPNCGESGIEVSQVPRNQGDQLLVNKGAFYFREPERWEVIVFRNPQQPTESYVKRAIGLPGESVRLIDGDVYINGKLVRKDLETQMAVRIPVFDSQFRPQDTEWQSRWLPDEGWQEDGAAFNFTHADKDPKHVAWLVYRHRLRNGGKHETKIPATVPIVAGFKKYVAGSSAYPLIDNERLWLDESERTLHVRGVIHSALKNRLLTASDNKEYVQAIETLAVQSHYAPIADVYGYNGEYGSGNEVRDLMVSLECERADAGLLIVDMHTGDRTLRMTLDATTSTLFVQDLRTKETVATYSVPGSILASPFVWDVSTFDRQVILAFNGEPLAVPIDLAEPSGEISLSSVPLRIGARGGPINLSRVRIYRDVYYTRGREKHAVSEPCVLADDEYFVLGDNSPVSADSRSWESAGVPRRLLVGKPFLVHLPSRPGKVRLGGPWRYIRIPDLTRVRYVR